MPFNKPTLKVHEGLCVFLNSQTLRASSRILPRFRAKHFGTTLYLELETLSRQSRLSWCNQIEPALGEPSSSVASIFIAEELTHLKSNQTSKPHTLEGDQLQWRQRFHFQWDLDRAYVRLLKARCKVIQSLLVNPRDGVKQGFCNIRWRLLWSEDGLRQVDWGATARVYVHASSTGTCSQGW